MTKQKAKRSSAPGAEDLSNAAELELQQASDTMATPTQGSLRTLKEKQREKIIQEVTKMLTDTNHEGQARAIVYAIEKLTGA